MLEYEASVKSWNSQNVDPFGSNSDPFGYRSNLDPPPPLAGAPIAPENVLVHTCTQDPIYRIISEI